MPLEGGFVIVKKPKDFPGIILSTHFRDFVFKFTHPDELVQWYHHLQSAVSKEVKIKKYAKRIKEQHEKLSNSNKATQYQKMVNDCEEKANELQKCFSLKKKFEKEQGSDPEFREYMDSVAKYSKV